MGTLQKRIHVNLLISTAIPGRENHNLYGTKRGPDQLIDGGVYLVFWWGGGVILTSADKQSVNALCARATSVESSGG